MFYELLSLVTVIILNLKKEIEITIKCDETSSQLKPVISSYVTTMHQPVLAIVTSNIYHMEGNFGGRKMWQIAC